MKILIGCEVSGVVRDAFRRMGHDAWSCDLLPAEGEYKHYHFESDVLAIMQKWSWDMAIFHPPCTYLSSSGLHWNGRTRGRAEETKKAIEFAERLWECNIPKIALENPKGCLPTFSKLMKSSQTIQPYEFGEDASKATCLWLKNLPLLTGTKYVAPRIVNGKERWANQTDSGQNRLTPSESRAAERAVTYQGIAEAFASQWGRV